MRSAHELHQAGLKALVGRRLPVARRLLDRAREAAGEPVLIARIEASRAFLTAEQGDLAAALKLCDAALVSEEITSETAGVLHGRKALILLRIGGTPAALEAFDVGIAKLANPVELGKAHINRGNVYLARGAGQKAAEDFATAASLLRDAGNPLEAAMAEHNLGYADLLRGDLVSALAHMDAVRPTLLPLSAIGAAICNQDRAEVLMAAGLTRRGLTALDETARTYGQHRMPHRRGEAELIIARASLARDPNRASCGTRGEGRCSRASTHPRCASKAEALVHGAEVRLGRTRPSLVPRGDDLAAELDALEPPAGGRSTSGSTRLWSCFVAVSRTRRAGDCARCGSRAPHLSPYVCATATYALPWPGAGDGGRPSPTCAADWTSCTTGSRPSAAWTCRRVTGTGRSLALAGIGLALASRRSPEVLFEWSERARELGSRVQPVRPPPDPELAADLSRIRRLTMSEPDEGSAEADELARLRARVRHRVWLARGSGQIGEVVEPTELVASLGADDALVSYVWHRRRLHALVITDDTTS